MHIGSIGYSGFAVARGQHCRMPLRSQNLGSGHPDRENLHHPQHDDGASAAVDAVSSRIRPCRALLVNDGHTRRILSTPRALASVGLAGFQRWRPLSPLPTPNSTIIVDASSYPSLADEAIIEGVHRHPRHPSVTSRPDTV
jgi:hypothetical protein